MVPFYICNRFVNCDSFKYSASRKILLEQPNQDPLKRFV
jgi:hypothetical protein